MVASITRLIDMAVAALQRPPPLHRTRPCHGLRPSFGAFAAYPFYRSFSIGRALASPSLRPSPLGRWGDARRLHCQRIAPRLATALPKSEKPQPAPARGPFVITESAPCCSLSPRERARVRGKEAYLHPIASPFNIGSSARHPKLFQNDSETSSSSPPASHPSAAKAGSPRASSDGAPCCSLSPKERGNAATELQSPYPVSDPR
jgi:hypothetical protein